MSIGEFADRSGLSPKRLRTYAAKGVLVPAAVDPSSGYRYYSTSQLRAARLVDALRQSGATIAEVADFLRRPSDEQFASWSRRLERETGQRRRALDAARALLADGPMPTLPAIDPTPKGDPMPMLKTASRTEIGLVRDANEDVVSTTDRLVVMADGMGGLPGGGLAASLAVSIVGAAFIGCSLDELRATIWAANRAIWEQAAAVPGLEGMGTTLCVVALLDDGRMAVGSVGDTRAYLLQNGGVRQVTTDDTVTAQLVREGQLTEEEVNEHPYRGVLTRALGVAPSDEVECSVLEVATGDRVLLGTDGLFNDLRAGELAAEATGGRQAQAIVDGLVELALSRGGSDNISAAVAEVEVA